MSQQSEIQFKGVGDGLLIQIGERPSQESYEDMTAALADRVQQQGRFFRDSKVALDVGNYWLTQMQIEEIQALFADAEMSLWAVLAERQETRDAARALGLAIRIPGSNTDLEGNSLAEEVVVEAEAEAAHWPADAAALFLKETIRSGQSLQHDGHIVLLGDVNPGGEIVATGDVIVWGRLRGMVHAGANGNEEAMICALELSPTQLRIAHHIAVAPSERPKNPQPEKAAVRQGQIVADSWKKRF